MNIIYEPKGRAREYSELACNIYIGCTHKCRYCFAPGCMRKTANEWHSKVTIRKNALTLFEKDAQFLYRNHDQRAILFSFLSDPYQCIEESEQLTHQALEIAMHYRLKTKVLTKGRARLIRRDLPLMRQMGTELGVTVCFANDTYRQDWEPDASPIDERLTILREAHDMGIFTWVSLEPVIMPEEALQVLVMLAPYVDLWKIGKINHFKEVEQQIDWRKFLREAMAILLSTKAKFYIKHDLLRYDDNANASS